MKKLATLISITGHPLITIPICVSIILLTLPGINFSVLETVLTLGLLIIPTTLWIVVKYKRGSYTNLDVSDKKQRTSLYLFVLPLLITVILFLHYSNKSLPIRNGFLFAFILFFVSFLINFRVKISLHVSLNTFLATSLFITYPQVSIIFLIFCIAIAWSRIVLKRHSYLEACLGFFLGLSTGLAFLFSLH